MKAVFIRLEDILKITEGNLICFVDNQKIEHFSEQDLDYYKNHIVVSLNATDSDIIIKLKPFETQKTDDCINDDWYKEHVKQFGTVPGFF